MKDCIFCKIARGEIKSELVYEDDLIVAFRDLNPQAPVHILFIPKEHISHIDEIEEGHKELIGHIYLKIKEVSKDLGLGSGYRVVVNNREDGGQSVSHIHFHLLGGRSLRWPPG